MEAKILFPGLCALPCQTMGKLSVICSQYFLDLYHPYEHTYSGTQQIWQPFSITFDKGMSNDDPVGLNRGEKKV